MRGVGVSSEKKTEASHDPMFIDLVFSWSVDDILNEGLYRNQVCFPLHSSSLHCTLLSTLPVLVVPEIRMKKKKDFY